MALARGVVGGGMDVGAARLSEGGPDRVADVAPADLAVAHQPGQDRQAGGVGGGPAILAKPPRAEVEARGRGRPPAVSGPAHVAGVEQLEQVAALALED